MAPILYTSKFSLVLIRRFKIISMPSLLQRFGELWFNVQLNNNLVILDVASKCIGLLPNMRY